MKIRQNLNKRPLLIACYILGMGLVGQANLARAQLPQVADSRLGVDVVRTLGGKRFYGFVLQRESDGAVRFAIERAWLASTYPADATAQQQLEVAESERIREQRLGRIREWINQRQGEEDRVLQVFLTRELARLDKDTAGESQAKFFVIKLPATEIRRLDLATPSHRHVAGIAFQNDLKDVTVSPASILASRLKEAGVDPGKFQVDLSQQLPSYREETNRQWEARRALVEYQVRKPLEYQGTGGRLFRTSVQKDAKELVAQFIAGGGMDTISQLGAELGLPEFKSIPSSSNQWWQKATQEAEKEGYRGVLLTRLHHSLLSDQVSVQSHFFAMENEGNWFQVAQFESTVNSSKTSADQIRKIQDDPQVQSVLETFKSLGIGVEDQLERALQQGAATQVALGEVKSQFVRYVERFVRSLDSPPVLLEARSSNASP